MLDAPRLPGQDGKTLTWRHMGGNKEGRPSGSPRQGGEKKQGTQRGYVGRLTFLGQADKN